MFIEKIKEEIVGNGFFEDCDRFIKICEKEFYGTPMEDHAIHQIKGGLSYMKSLYEEAAKKSGKNVKINMDLEPESLKNGKIDIKVSAIPEC